MEQFYSPGIRRDPVEAFRTWFSIVWDGGTVTRDWLDRSYDLKPQPVERFTPAGSRESIPITWTVRGLREILPDADHYEFDELRELGVGMLENYKRYAAENDGFEVIAAEHDFSVPIWDYENNCILKAVDVREQSPNYGKSIEVHARGRQDILYANPNARMGILDHKTADRVDNVETLEIKLEGNEQVTTYLWAAEIEAQYYDLPWKGEPFEEVIYNVLRKAAPMPPTVLRSGLFSIDRKQESATYDLIRDFMDEAGIKYSELPEKHQAYVDWLREAGDEQFFVRKLVRRNRHQLKNAGYRIYLEALDMLGEPRIYPNITGGWDCLNCAFRPPCMAKEAGEDWQYLIKENYSVNRDR